MQHQKHFVTSYSSYVNYKVCSIRSRILNKNFIYFFFTLYQKVRPAKNLLISNAITKKCIIIIYKIVLKCPYCAKRWMDGEQNILQ